MFIVARTNFWVLQNFNSMVSEGGYATSQLTNENYDYADHYMRDLKAYSNYMANFKPGY